MTDSHLIELTADIVSAHVANNDVAAVEVPALIQSIFTALARTQAPAAPEPVKAEPAVAVRSSVKHDHIVCLEDGKKLKMLKRYLRTNYNMTPDDYRKKWGLPRDYPMVAPAYAEQRRGLAKAIGLGRKMNADTKPAVAAEPRKRARPAGIKAAKEAAQAHLAGNVIESTEA